MSSINSPMTLAKSDIFIKRSGMKLQNRKLMTMSSGYLYPFACIEVLPGDTFNLDTTFLTRMNTPIHPTMGDAYQDIFWFYVPNRIVMDRWKEFLGESPKDKYLNPVEYTLPRWDGHLGEEYGPVPFKSILDYLGYPAGNIVPEINSLKIRGFCQIWNEYFRDQNLQNAIDVQTDQSTVNLSQAVGSSVFNPELPTGYLALENYYAGSTPDFYVTSSAAGGVLPPVNKLHDLFTSATLEAQKGDPVPIPAVSFNSEWLPVMARSSQVYDDDSLGLLQPLNYAVIQDSQNDESLSLLSNGQTGVNGYSSGYSQDSYFSSQGDITPSNLWAKTSSSDANAYASINDLRYAFALQSFLETDNRYGTRYRELIFGHYRVQTKDASIQIPEFLAHKRYRIGMSQVVQNSATNDVSPQGNLAAYSLTTDSDRYFLKSFEEHGFVFGVTCIRTHNSYEQAIDKSSLYKTKLDFYFPEFASIGDQPIRVPEVWNDNQNGLSEPPVYWEQFFGFQEAWYQYRYLPDTVSGEFRSNYLTSLNYWTYGNNFVNQPYLSDGFIRQDRSLIDRTLASNDPSSDQFLCDFYVSINAVRPLPIYSMGATLKGAF